MEIFETINGQRKWFLPSDEILLLPSKEVAGIIATLGKLFKAPTWRIRVGQKNKKSHNLFFAGVYIIVKYIKNIYLNFPKQLESILITLKDPKNRLTPYNPKFFLFRL